MPRELSLHDRIRLLREIAGVPAGAVGTIVLVYEQAGGVGVALDDRRLAPTIDGIIDVSDLADLEFVPSQHHSRSAA